MLKNGVVDSKESGGADEFGENEAALYLESKVRSVQEILRATGAKHARYVF